MKSSSSGIGNFKRIQQGRATTAGANKQEQEQKQEPEQGSHGS
jgi:hypothetical protein